MYRAINSLRPVKKKDRSFSQNNNLNQIFLLNIDGNKMTSKYVFYSSERINIPISHIKKNVKFKRYYNHFFFSFN